VPVVVRTTPPRNGACRDWPERRLRATPAGLGMEGRSRRFDRCRREKPPTALLLLLLLLLGM